MQLVQWLRVAGYELRVTGYEVRVAGYEVRPGLYLNNV